MVHEQNSGSYVRTFHSRALQSRNVFERTEKPTNSKTVEVLCNYWMRLSRIWRIQQIKVGVIHRSRRPRWITPSEICRILHILRKSNSIIALSVKWVKPWSQDWLRAAGAYPSFCRMKQLDVFLLPLDGMLVHRRSLPQQFSYPFTVLCKSNAGKFRQISWLFVAFRRNFASNEISATFPRTFKSPIVLFLPNFPTIIRGGR